MIACKAAYLFSPVRFANVSYSHFADIPTAPVFVRYWSNSGQWTELARVGSVDICPQRTLANRRDAYIIDRCR
jgi:hypothetical protein